MVSGGGIQNQSAITAFFAGKGLTAAQIAGIEGNIQVESGGNPGAYNPKENAHGIAQWENGRYSGPNGLLAFAQQTGGSASDLTTQLGFYWQELQTSERGALDALLAATTPAQAATAIQSKYERSASSSLPTRVADAQAIYAGGVQGGSGRVDLTSGGVQNASSGGGMPGWLNGLGSLLIPGFGIETQVAGDKAGQVWGRVTSLLLSGLIIVLGCVLLVVALVLLAKSASGGSSSSSAPAPEHRAEHAAEDAAVAA